MAAGVDCLSRDAAVRHPLWVMHNDRPGWWTSARMTPGAPTDSERGSMCSVPSWLRDLGFASWLLAGFILILIGMVWLLGETSTIVMPVVLALVLGAVAGPIVDALERRALPRAAVPGSCFSGSS
jgi:hypothetical protein